jgi:Holliday junction resolvase-like predicted endonuclease
LGEKIAIRFLESKGYIMIERNYRKKWGEIDIVCKKGRRVYFVEVKTVSRDLSGVDSFVGWYRSEDNVHPSKLVENGGDSKLAILWPPC